MTEHYIFPFLGVENHTEKAILVKLRARKGYIKRVWIPKSLVAFKTIKREKFIKIPRWFVEKKFPDARKPS